ncbi:Alpha-galactosidase [Lachnellula suecica]|uniref:Alpha-galactosidase n=1 Tax=Lachnellula suecica TaxID=602035 RepID=A0A8T9BU50_9HELO|nr:Alpha-galactosidase [Lachnellula suecica]
MKKALCGRADRERGVDFIKLDYMTPGSPDYGETLSSNRSGAATAYHNATKNIRVSMRLDISWKLDRSDPYWQDTHVSYATVLRTLDFYRQFINEQTTAAPNGQAIMRYTQAIHWLGVGANLIMRSNLTRIDTLGNELLFNAEALSAAAFTAQFPMQPRNQALVKTVLSNYKPGLQDRMDQRLW